LLELCSYLTFRFGYIATMANKKALFVMLVKVVWDSVLPLQGQSSLNKTFIFLSIFFVQSRNRFEAH
jgi:hypothetical protein